MATTTMVSQLSCFASISRKIRLHRRPVPFPVSLRSKLSVVMSLEEHGANFTNPDMKSTLDYTVDVSNSYGENVISPIVEEQCAGQIGINDQIHEYDVSVQKRAAKIHDFCFGIPFGGLVLGGGIFGSIFSRSPETLFAGLLFGGALLTLSTCSLKIWQQGKSSLPFILGQAALSVAFLWKNIRTYSMTKKLFPTGFYAVISAAMLCFYSYVMISGGNPPPKKLKSSASVAPAR